MARWVVWRVPLGLEHGAYCVGCCWALMLLLFAGGVMNLTVIAALTASSHSRNSYRFGLARRADQRRAPHRRRILDVRALISLFAPFLQNAFSTYKSGLALELLARSHERCYWRLVMDVKFEDLVAVLFAAAGLFGGAYFHLRTDAKPIVVAIFIATGIAALVYRFLGGITDTTFTIKSLKLGGTMAALLGSAFAINSALGNGKCDRWRFSR